MVLCIVFSYKVELKHESWKNVKLLIDLNMKFSRVIIMLF